MTDVEPSRTYHPTSPGRLLHESATRWVIILLVLSAIFRLWYCTYNDLVGDEAYYWLWSKHLDASYYSKGPAVAWTIAFGTHLFGNTVFGVRWLSVMLSLGTGWQLYLLASRLYSPLFGWWVVLVAAVTPLFSIGSVLMTIDPLSVFFWVCSCNLFLSALEKPAWYRWTWTGFAVGCGFLSKYTNALQLLSFLLFFALSPIHRPLFFRRDQALLWIAFLVTAFPVLWWNQHHHWITAVHLEQNGRLDEKLHISLGEFAKFVEGQALVISPLLFMSILIAVITLACRKASWQQTFLHTLFWPIFLLYALLSFHDAANPNWTALAYITGSILAVVYWHPLATTSRPAAMWCVVTLAVAFLMTTLAHETFPLNLHKDPLMRVRGWKDWGLQAAVFRDKYRPDYLMANDNDIASELSFYLPGQPQTYIPDTGRIQNQFSFWPTYSHGPGTRVLYITDDPINTLPGLLNQEFSHIEPVGRFDRSYRGRHIASYRVWLLTN